MRLARRGHPGRAATGDRMGGGRGPSPERRSGGAAIAVEVTPVVEPAQERSWPTPLQIGLVLFTEAFDTPLVFKSIAHLLAKKVAVAEVRALLCIVSNCAPCYPYP